jgi:hypothetical protein
MIAMVSNMVSHSSSPARPRAGRSASADCNLNAGLS